MRTVFSTLILAALLAVSACASGGGTRSQADALTKAQYAWSAAIRWGDWDGALAQLDPASNTPPTLSDLERSRWQQVRITAYRVLGTENAAPGEAARLVEIGLVNTNTMTERTVRYRETWRWDESKKAWWNTAGLPDVWQGN